MNQLTVRGFNPELTHLLKTMTLEEHISLSQAALKLMMKGAGISHKVNNNTVGKGLDDFIGSWSKEEANSFDDHTASLRTIDDEIWQ